ncbi:hypothetical protein ACFLX7_01820 [Chloroflexota bacterium]
MGEKNGDNDEGVFHSVCDDCAQKLKLEERLPELLQAIAAHKSQKDAREFIEMLQQDRVSGFASKEFLYLSNVTKSAKETDLFQ